MPDEGRGKRGYIVLKRGNAGVGSWMRLEEVDDDPLMSDAGLAPWDRVGVCSGLL